MKYVPFGDTGLRVSVLGFGCAPMGSRFGRRESLRALEAAHDSGVTLFDTARAYGHGDSERILGEFLRGKRDRVVVSTKFGMTAPRSTPVRRLLKAVARRVFRVAPGLRQAAAPQLGAQFSHGAFSAAQMQASVEQSLTELRTDRLDVLFLHGCPAAVLDDDELFGRLDDLVRAGKVLHYGVAGSAAVITAGLPRRPRVRAVQFHQSLLAQTDAATVTAEPAAAGAGTIAHQPFGGGTGLIQMRTLLEAMRRSDEAPEGLRSRLEHLDARALADIALNGVITGTGIDAAVGSMFTIEHVRTNAAVAGASRFSDEELAAIQRYFRAHAKSP